MQNLCASVFEALVYQSNLLLCGFRSHVGHLDWDVVGPHPVFVPLEVVADL